MDKEKLSRVLRDHGLWLSGAGGARTDLSEANLSEADLRGAKLCDCQHDGPIMDAAAETILRLVSEIEHLRHNAMILSEAVENLCDRLERCLLMSGTTPEYAAEAVRAKRALASDKRNTEGRE